MESAEYLIASSRTDMDEHQIEAGIKRLSVHSTFNLNHACQGMQTEAGEATDIMKRHIHYGKDIDYVHLQEEIGDLLWYIALAIREIAKHKKCSFASIMRMNIHKLYKRYKEKFNGDEALCRDLDKERESLEENANNN